MGSIKGEYPDNSMYGLLSFSNNTEGKSLKQSDACKAVLILAMYVYWPFYELIRFYHSFTDLLFVDLKSIFIL